MFNKAKWIYGENTQSDSKYSGPEGAGWVWAYEYCRIQAKKEFMLKNAPISAKTYFVCDNKFDLYINGCEIMLNNNEADVTSFLRKGNNIIAVRAYQTDDAKRFLSAFRGGLTIELSNKEKVEVLTDSSWKQLRLCTFGEGKETKNWQTESIGESGSSELFWEPFYSIHYIIT